MKPRIAPNSSHYVRISTLQELLLMFKLAPKSSKFILCMSIDGKYLVTLYIIQLITLIKIKTGHYLHE